jgi:hypothetical protein
MTINNCASINRPKIKGKNVASLRTPLPNARVGIEFKQAPPVNRYKYFE